MYPACQNLLLAARGPGLRRGADRVAPRRRGRAARACSASPTHVALSACITLGVPAGRHGPLRRKPLSTLVHDGRWGRPRRGSGTGRWLTTRSPCSAWTRAPTRRRCGPRGAASPRSCTPITPAARPRPCASSTWRSSGPWPTPPRSVTLRRTVGSRWHRPASAGPPATGRRVAHDVASFTIEALPVEAFEALLVVATWLGEVLVDDPPYQLDVALGEPFECWCRLDLVPDAGASTVALTLASLDGRPVPDLDAVRDAWVANLNTLGRPTLTLIRVFDAPSVRPQETLGPANTRMGIRGRRGGLGQAVADGVAEAARRGGRRRPVGAGTRRRPAGRRTAGARRRRGRRRGRPRRPARPRARTAACAGGASRRAPARRGPRGVVRRRASRRRRTDRWRRRRPRSRRRSTSSVGMPPAAAAAADRSCSRRSCSPRRSGSARRRARRHGRVEDGPRSATTCSAVVGLTRPKRLADGAAMPARPRQELLGHGVSRHAHARPCRDPRSRRRAPARRGEQQRQRTRPARVGEDGGARRDRRPPSRRASRGRCGRSAGGRAGRSLTAKIRSTARGSSASAPSPYTVSVGMATSPPALSRPTATATSVVTGHGHLARRRGTPARHR